MFVCRQVSSVPSRCGVNDMLTQWGQFITHDIDHTSKLPDFLLFKSSYALLPISVPKVQELQIWMCDMTYNV